MSNSMKIRSISILKLCVAIGICAALQACLSSAQVRSTWAWETIATTGQPTARHEASFLEHKGKL